MTSPELLAAYGLDGMPVVLALVCLFLIVLARSHATYWAGRAVARGATSEGVARRGPPRWPRTVERTASAASRPGVQRGVRLVHRWGPVAVTLAYVTVGVQTAVFIGAGLVRMPYLRFTVASLPGAAAWALIWGTVGAGAVWAALSLGTGTLWDVLVLAVVVGLVTGALLTVRRRRRPTAPVAVPVDEHPTSAHG